MNCRVKRRHQQCGGGALAGDVPQRNNQAAILALNEIVIVSANFITRKTDALKFVTGHYRRRRWLKALLDLHSKLQLTLETLLLKSRFNQARVLDANGRHRGQSGQHLEMVFGKSSFSDWRIGVNDSEHFL